MCRGPRDPPDFWRAPVSGSRDRGKADLDSEAAVWLGLGGDLGVVCVGDCLDNGEAKPDALGGVHRTRCEAPEGLEETLDVAGGDQLSGVGDAKDRTPRLRTCHNLDPAARDVVTDRVRDEVADEPLEEVWVAGGPHRLE